MSAFYRSSYFLTCAVFSFPLILVLLSWFFKGDNAGISYIFEQGLLFEYSKNSVILALGTGIISFVLGVGTAYFVVFTAIPFKRILKWMLILPIAMPGYVAAIVYADILDSAGFIQLYIRDFSGLAFGEYWFPKIRSIEGAIFVLSFTLYPYVYLLCYSAFSNQSNQLLDSGRLLGLNNAQLFFRLLLPITRPMIVAGVALVVMESLADFGVVSLYGVPAYTTGIYRAWNGMYDPISAAQMASLLLMIVFVALWFEQTSRRKINYSDPNTVKQKKQPFPLSKGMNIFGVVFCFVPVILGFLLPLAVIAYWSFGQLDALSDRYTVRALLNSVMLGGMVAIIASVIGLLMAVFMRYNNKNKLLSAITRFATLGYAMPGSVVAVGVLLLLITIQKDIFNGNVMLVGTLAAVVWACVFRFLTISYNSIDSGLKSVTNTMDDVAKTLGENSRGVMFRVHIPNIYRSLLVGLLLVFIDTVKELPATILLRPFNFDTLAIRTYELAHDELLQRSGPSALLLILVSIVPIWFINRRL